MSGIAVHDMAGHQPIEQHPDCGQVRLGVGAAELLDIGGDVHGRHRGEVL